MEIYGNTSMKNPQQKQTQRKKKEMVISIDAGKAFDKIPHTFRLKVLERRGTQGPYLNTVKAMYTKPRANIKINGE